MTTEATGLSARFFKSKEFFPIDINFGDAELIRLTKRPRKATTEIIDLYSNKIHIGMFVGIEKVAKELHFGPAGINRSHQYRNILSFTFLKLLEYFGLDNVDAILIDIPEDLEFKGFLKSLGFIPKKNKMILELTGDGMKIFTETLDKTDIQVESQVGQIQAVLKQIKSSASDEAIAEQVDIIVEKIKNMAPLGKEFWDNRRVASLNVYLAAAQLLPEKLNKEEFLDLLIKTIVTSFETYVREPYLEELMLALEGKKIFSMPFIQKMVEITRKLLPKEIEEMKKDHFRKWLYENLPAWKLHDKMESETRKGIIDSARLSELDFGNNIPPHMVDIAKSLVDHYNGENIFFGMGNRF